MGRYVLLEFDDNEAADKFVETLKASQVGTEGPMDRDMTAGVIAAAHSTVLAAFAKASKICDCAKPSENSVRGMKLGWWVCPVCKKPKRRAGQSLRNLLNKKLINTTRLGSPGLIVRWDVDEDGKVVTLIES